ncbi:sugar hydrolase [Parachaetomium inaequale]|uniref:alpha-D-xyloside xylohydrolase n=1 Tax=Parachaetomium inaequale TaxID=2588326 RepID=A0AAN6SLF3_9PEZI|nr:sugar hydrolase [Parachaetomium inaequale]
MKFTHGYWFDRDHTSIYNAVEVAEVTEPQPGQLRALCATRHVSNRGDTLNRPTITLNISAAASGIISCSAWHFRGAKSTEPRFKLFPEAKDKDTNANLSHNDSSNTSTVSSGGIRAVLNKNPSAFRIAFESTEDGKTLTDVGFASLQHAVGPPNQGIPSPLEASTNIADPYYRAPASRSNKPYMSVSLGLEVGEYVYGLGERFGPFVKNGQEIDLWNEDAGTCTPYTYKNVPFYMTNRGYGIFFDHSDVLSYEIQNEKLAKVQVSIQGEEIRWFVIYGPTPKDILRRYASLTGHPPLPPTWSFGLYLSTSFLTDYDEKTVNTQLDGMASRDIPVSVLHFDCFWMRAHAWTNFTFDPKFFPDAKAFLGRLHQRGVKVCVWINAYIAQDSEVFDEAVEKGYLIRRLDGSVWQSDIWQAGMAVVDFTNPDARKWYQAQLETLLDIGVDTFKTDFGERIPWEDVQFHNGMDPRAGHNYYSLLYNQAVYGAITRKRGASQAAVFARAATAGGQTLPVHWGGDCESTWSGMAQSLRGGLSLGLCGFAFWSHDIGGFMSEGLTDTTPAAAIYKRWLQFGLFSSHSRLHGSHTYRVPWLVDDEASAVLGRFARLKNMLMPYIYAQAIECCRDGLPLLRAMFVEFPEDRVCQTLDQQYMFGDSLLVAPVFNAEGVCEYYVPAGRWMGLLDGKKRVGPAWVKETFDNFHLPLLLREDRALLVGTCGRPDYDWSTSLTKVVVGSASGGGVIEAPVPSASELGQFGGRVRVSSASGDDKPHWFSVERSGQGEAPELLVLGEGSHL